MTIRTAIESALLQSLERPLERRLALLLVSPELILRFLTKNPADDELTWFTVSGIPEDVQIRGVHYSPEHAAYAITLEHPDFAPVHEGAMLPLLTPLWTTHRLPVVRDLPDGTYFALDERHMPILVRKVEDAH